MQTVLIANRGEIAVRIVRACRSLGLRSIAVFSEADRGAPHTLLADEAHALGPAPASESYLSVERILEVARRTGADAVHPGYGFLSEREAFARAVEASGRIFVGPSPDSIARMGDKAEARRTMDSFGLPLVPGTEAPVRSPGEAVRMAEGIGYPLLLKAVAGGGGKGMRVVREPGELERAFEAAAREAQGAFGDGALYLERYLDRPRHIEVQVLGDGRGGAVHLGERECSIQRRHQKLVEEAPAPALDPELRAAMTGAAVEATRSLRYRGAGTFEFLVQDGAFHFIEMNTRIQVEHPVTEMVTGVDLVAWQLRIARGEPLDLPEETLRSRGHAVEVRITAEDPVGGFLPATGTVRHLELPSGPGIRWDGGIGMGTRVGAEYDPLLGKLIAHGPTRGEALRRLETALDELVIVGVETSIPFLRRLVREPDFRRGDLSTRYLDAHPALVAPPGPELRRILAVAGALLDREAGFGDRRPAAAAPPAGLSAWQRALHSGRGPR